MCPIWSAAGAPLNVHTANGLQETQNLAYILELTSYRPIESLVEPQQSSLLKGGSDGKHFVPKGILRLFIVLVQYALGAQSAHRLPSTNQVQSGSHEAGILFFLLKHNQSLDALRFTPASL